MKSILKHKAMNPEVVQKNANQCSKIILDNYDRVYSSRELGYDVLRIIVSGIVSDINQERFNNHSELNNPQLQLALRASTDLQAMVAESKEYPKLKSCVARGILSYLPERKKRKIHTDSAPIVGENTKKIIDSRKKVRFSDHQDIS